MAFNFSDDNNSDTPFFQSSEPEPAPAPVKPVAKKKKSKRILGMTAIQRLIISVLFFGLVCVVGTLALVVFGAFHLPFF